MSCYIPKQKDTCVSLFPSKMITMTFGHFLGSFRRS